MGNQLVGIAPSQIYPVEHYLIGSHESDLQYESRYYQTQASNIPPEFSNSIELSFFSAAWEVRVSSKWPAYVRTKVS